MADLLEDQIRSRIKGTQAAYSINLLGEQSTPEAIDVAQTEAQSKSTLDIVKAGFSANSLAVGAYDWVKREMIAPDAAFKPEDHMKEVTDSGIPFDLQDGFLRTNSLEEFRQYKSDLLKEEQNKALLGAAGARGLVASALTGLLDLDTPLMFMTGGLSKVGTLSSIGLENTRLSQITRNAVIGGELGAIHSTANAMIRPTGEWTDIPEMTLGGMIFGAGIGTLTSKQANLSADATRTEFNTSNVDGWAGSRDPRSFDTPTPLYPQNTFNAEQSIGAASTVPGVAGLSPSTEQLIKSSKEYLRTTDWVNKTEFRETPAGNAAKRFYDVLKKTPLASDWDKLANSNSTIASALAHKIFESPSGIVRNNRSAAMLKDYYENNLLDVNRIGTKLYSDYAGLQGKTFRDLEYHSTVRNQFDREVMLELNSRYHEGASAPGSSKPVKEMADAIDHYSARALEYMKGKGDETPLAGSEGLDPKEGWFRQIWRGDKMRELMKKTPNGEKNIVQGIANAYQRLYNFAPEDATLYAKAVLRRSMSLEEGINTNLINMLQQDGRTVFEKFLLDNGFDTDKIKSLVDSLVAKGAQKKQEGFTKQRLDIDLRENIPGTPYQLLDLIDTDVQKVWSRYARGVSGSSALARHGIQRADKEHIVNAMRQELFAKGDTSVPETLLDSIFSNFESGPIAGGQHVATVMATRLTNLATLNSLGLTQMAETGTIIGAVGLDAFKATAPKEIQAILNGKKTPIVEELERWTGPVGDSHLLHNDMYTFEIMKNDAAVPTELMHYMQGLISKGQRVQGYVSGFYAVHSLQQKIAVSAMVDKLSTLMKKDINSKEARRLYDMGLDEKTSAKIQGYFKNTVKYDEAGKLESLNLDKWNPVDREDFRLALNRHTYQVVQKAMAGESSMWMHKDMGALFTHLKSFTMLTIQKQALRNMAMADAEAQAAVTYGLMTAGMAYAAKQITQGRDQNLTPHKIIKGAIGMSNFTGFLPMFTDPVATMLGMDNWRFNHYGMTDVSTGIVPTPVAIPTLNRLMHIPGAMFGLATGNYTKNDVRAMQAMPIFGNAPIIGAIWQGMYDENKNKGTTE